MRALSLHRVCLTNKVARPAMPGRRPLLYCAAIRLTPILAALLRGRMRTTLAEVAVGS